MSNYLKLGIKPRLGDLGHLAVSLNRLRDAFTFAVKTANASKPAADKVCGAIGVLIQFFEERRRACCPKDGSAPNLEIVKAERALHNKRQDFVTAMQAHDFQLNMDAGLLMPDIENWRDIAYVIASSFKAATARTNSNLKLGLSNDGPVPRFVAAVIPLITGETPEVTNVGRHLKDMARKEKKAKAKTGTAFE